MLERLRRWSNADDLADCVAADRKYEKKDEQEKSSGPERGTNDKLDGGGDIQKEQLFGLWQ